MHAHHKGDSQLGLRKVCGYVAVYVWLILTTTISIGKINSETFFIMHGSSLSNNTCGPFY